MMRRSARPSHGRSQEKSDSKELAKLKLEFDKLCMKDEVLVRKLVTHEQVVLLKNLRPLIFKHLHTDMGHLGADRVGELARKRVYWPGMQKDIMDFIQHKCACLKQRKPQRSKKVAPLQRITTNAPLEMITIDFLHLEKGSGGYEYILVIVDHFTKFVQAYPTRNKFTKTVAKHLYDDFILRFGIPTKILSDQGGEFESKVIHELCALSGVTKLRTTPYHPQTNGLCERMNRTLLHMLRTLPETMKTQWPSMVNKMTHAYNCTKHSSTGFSPCRLMFGREATLSIDLTLGLINHAEEIDSYTKLARKWDDQLQQAYAIVRQNQKSRQDANEAQSKKKPMLMPLEVGDRVLIKNTETGGPGKLRSYWEQDVYRILAKKGDLDVVLEVRKEDDLKARRRVVHRNMLLPVDDQFGLDDVASTDDQMKLAPGCRELDKSCVQKRAASGKPKPASKGPVTRSSSRAQKHATKDPGKMIEEDDSDQSEEIQEDSDEDYSFTPNELHQLLRQPAAREHTGSLKEVSSEVNNGTVGGSNDTVHTPNPASPMEVGQETFDEMFGERGDDTFHGFDLSSPKEVGQEAFDEMFGESGDDTFQGFDPSSPKDVDRAYEENGEEGSFHDLEEPDTATSMSTRDPRSRHSIQLDILESDPLISPCTKAKCRRIHNKLKNWEEKRAETRNAKRGMSSQEELRRSKRELEFKHYNPTMNSVAVQTERSIGTQTEELESDLSQWLR